MPNPLQPGHKVGAGRFTLVKPLGRGGMGEVWLAQDERLQEQVALKFLPPEVRADPVALDDLRRETARSHRLTHPNIVRIHDLHEDADGTAFIVMEYIDGPTLAALRLEQPNRVLTWGVLQPLVRQLCAALDYAHGENVIHRDLKPANIMVDAKGRVKLADFGIAAVVSDSMSRVSLRHTSSGTLVYMSPQQLAGKRPQASDDIYALGATLYELLTSKPPFYTGDLSHQVLHELPEPMEERLAAFGTPNEIPGDVAALVMACLAKEPGQRPQSDQAVAEWIGLEIAPKSSLEALSSDVFSQPAEAEPVPPAAPKSSAKLMWAGAAFGALLLLALGGWYWASHSQKEKAVPKQAQTAPPEANSSSPPPEPTVATAPAPVAYTAVKKLLVVTVTKGYRHGSIPTGNRVLKALAIQDGRFTFDFVDSDEEMAAKMNLKALQHYDGVIFNNTVGDLPLPDKKGFLDWIASGKAFIGIHAALATFRGKTPLDPYILMLGAEESRHGQPTAVECLNQDPQHPACKQLPLRWTVSDEIFILNGFDPRTDHTLLTLDKEPNKRTPGNYPISWSKDYGKGKVFVTSLGHRDEVWESDNYKKHILGGICWALGLEKAD